jgi:hypothetical protein
MWRALEQANLTAQQAIPGFGMLIVHVLAVTLLANLGKMFPAFLLSPRGVQERLALAIGMWPRGESALACWSLASATASAVRSSPWL